MDDLIGLLKYPGSKDKLSRQMLKWGVLGVHHDLYCEPFCGSAETFWHRPLQVPATLNDKNPTITNLLRVLRDDGLALQARLRLQPYSRQTWEWGVSNYFQAPTALDQAAACFFVHNMGFTGRPLRSYGQIDTPSCAKRVPTYLKLIDSLHLHQQRLTGVEVTTGLALDAIHRADSPTTLHYCDPPYERSTRLRPRDPQLYPYEMLERAEHIELIHCLNDLSGMVLLSGYASELYDRMMPHYTKMSYDTFIAMQAMRPGYTHAMKRRAVTELVWCNPRLMLALSAGTVRWAA